MRFYVRIRMGTSRTRSSCCFVAGALINQHLNEDRREPVYIQPAPIYSYPQNPVYVQPYVIRPEPRVIVCQDYQNYDHYGRPYGIQRVCR